MKDKKRRSEREELMVEKNRPQNADTYTDEERALLAKHVTNVDAQCYCVKNLPEEVIAVLFAYVSRSPLSFRRNLLKLIGEGAVLVNEEKEKDAYGVDDEGYAKAKEKAQRFHDKWVVGYGHSSVAEHADIKFALEDVSIIATKVIEDNRLGRYTEKSTRYVKFDKGHYHKPARLLADEKLGPVYERACNALFDAYEALYPKMCAFIRAQQPKPADMKERPYEASVNAKACDLVRYILPASTYTMVGCSMNARVAAHAITKLLSHPLEEMRVIGNAMLAEGRKICPTLLKHAAHNEYLNETRDDIKALADEFLTEAKGDAPAGVTLECNDPEPEAVLVAAILYEESNAPFKEVLEKTRAFSNEEKERVLTAYVGKKGRFDWPQRALEHVRFTTDTLMDYGAFRDVQRHRMNTQTGQRVTTTHGYEVPEEIIHAGYKEEFENAMQTAAEAYEQIVAVYPWEAQYVVPLAYRKRTLFTWNLRNLEHVIRLRSTPQGHTAYRRIAQQLYDVITAKHPLLAKLLTVDKDEYYLGRLKSELKTEAKRAAIATKEQEGS